jgi:predicted nucleotidyltransferase
MDLAGVRDILARHAHLFRRAYVYGSVARGSQDEASDVDLVLVRDTPLPFFDRLREVFDLVDDLGRADVLIYTEDEERRLRQEPGRYFVKDVFASGVLIEGTQGRSASVAAAG